jgi:hypothetical protein
VLLRLAFGSIGGGRENARITGASAGGCAAAGRREPAFDLHSS